MTKPKAKPRKSKATGARKGGKPGNQNARKHGLWAKNQPPVNTTGKATVKLNQIEARRDIMDSVVETLYQKFSSLQDIDQICKCANSISLAVTAANGCDRTLAITSGRLTNLESAIEQLLANEDPNDLNTFDG